MKKIPKTVTTINVPTALLRRALNRAKALYGRRGFSAYITQLINLDLQDGK